MSSVQSPASAPSRLTAVRAALVEVAENAFFVFVEPCELDEYRRLTADSSPAWLRTTVEYEGSADGRMSLDMPEELGRWLVGSWLGLGPVDTVTDQQLLDGVGEFANQVCGAWLSRSEDGRLFRLRSPLVSRIPRDGSFQPGAEGTEGLVSMNDLPMAVWVS